MKQFFGQTTLLLLLTLGLFSLNSCEEEKKEEKKYENKVINYTANEPVDLNPITNTEAAGRVVQLHLYQRLIELDLFDYVMVPVLAKELPTVTALPNGWVEMAFEIRSEAKWDNGTPITARDVEFSLMLMNAPHVNNKTFQPYFDFIKEVAIDAENPKKFTLLCDKPYMQMADIMGDIYIVPAYFYDTENALADYTLKQMTSDDPALEKDKKIMKFATEFNSPKFQREVMNGSGPYTLKDWTTGQRVSFVRKKDWWAKDIKDNHFFDAKPEEIIYEVVADPTTAVVAMKAEKIETMQRIDPRLFAKELKPDAAFTDKFNLYTPTQFIYSYYGLNSKNPKLADVRTRKAMQYIVDVPKFIETIFYGMAERITSYNHPSKKKFINPNIEMYMQDLDKARALLKEAGWEDSNGNGVLDMEINGERTELNLQMQYPNVSKAMEKGILMFKEFARKVGVEIDARPVEFSVMLQNIKSHDFEMYSSAWSSSPQENDPKQIWHTDSYNGGSNYVGFGNARSDELIEKLRGELDEAKRIAYHFELQKTIYDESVYVFMTAPQNRLAIHKKFNNVKASGINPGFYAPSFKVMNAIND